MRTPEEQYAKNHEDRYDYLSSLEPPGAGDDDDDGEPPENYRRALIDIPEPLSRYRTESQTDEEYLAGERLWDEWLERFYQQVLDPLGIGDGSFYDHPPYNDGRRVIIEDAWEMDDEDLTAKANALAAPLYAEAEKS